LCSERVGQITKTYRDIEAVTHLLEEKERDLELAARIGQSLLKQNKALTERNKLLDEQLEITKEEIAQLRHELSMRDDLLHFYASTEDIEHASETLLIQSDSSSSLSNYINYDFLQQKLKGLEEENCKLRTVANELTFETNNYEEQEQQLMMVCVDELSTANKQVCSLSEELSRKVEDSLRQQEEISGFLGQIVDLEQRCKGLTAENEELTQHLNASRESQSQLKTELKELQERYSECEDMLHEAREDIKNLRNKSLPNSTVQRYSTLAAVVPMDSLAAEIEGTFRRGLDSPAPTEYKVPLLYLQTVIEGVVRTLKVMHGSLDSCFCEEENAARLDHFFCLFFQQLIQPWRLIDSSRPPSPDISGSLFLDGLPAVRWLTLPADIKVEVDTVLSDFESSDFGDMSEDFYGMRRLYVILGSCLFYKVSDEPPEATRYHPMGIKQRHMLLLSVSH
ncbi:hypothetical protein cypCar_00047551, partial [Cyprinus carpio]